MTKIPFGNYRPFGPSLSVGSCNCAYSGSYNEECEFYHKEYHMGGYVSTCLNQDVFGWCECNRCSKNTQRLIDVDVPYKGSVRRVLLSAPTIVSAEGGIEHD